MKLKKLNAAVSLLTVLAMLVHVGYTAFAYLAFFYDPLLKKLTAAPFMILVCAHAVMGMTAVFLQTDGTRADLYPRLNRGTVIQRVTAALIFPMLILHMNTFRILSGAAEAGRTGLFWLVLLVQPLFYAVVLSHAAVSCAKALITLGLLSDRGLQKRIDRAVYIIFAAVFCIAAYAVLRGQLTMFLPQGGLA